MDDFERLALAREVGETPLRVAANLERVVVDAAAQEGLTPSEARLLRSAESPATQSEIAERLGIDNTRVSVMTGAPEQRGLLRRVPDRSDRRVRRPQLTAAGRETADRIGFRLAAASPLLTALDSNDLAALLGLLVRLDGERSPADED